MLLTITIDDDEKMMKIKDASTAGQDARCHCFGYQQHVNNDNLCCRFHARACCIADFGSKVVS
jgi:hypothetical protein